MAGIFWAAFDKTKLRSHLLMGLERFKLLNNRRRNEMQMEKREIGVLLRDKQYDRARIRVESVIRKDSERQACEILETMVDLIAARITLIATEKACSADMVESVQTVMWASKRLQVEELHEVRNQLALKYGDAFAAAAMRGEGAGSAVNARVKELLTIAAPLDSVKLHYLTEIAAAQNVSFDPKDMAKGGILPPMAAGGAAAGPTGLGPAPATDLPCCGGKDDSDSDGDHHKPSSGGGGGGIPAVAPGGTTIVTGADGSTTIYFAPAPAVPGGGYIPTSAATAAAGLPSGVILDPFSAAAAASAAAAHYGGGAPGGGLPPYGGMPGFPYAPVPPMVDPAAAAAGATYADGLPPHMRGGAGGAVASPGYTYGAAAPAPAAAAAAAPTEYVNYIVNAPPGSTILIPTPAAPAPGQRASPAAAAAPAPKPAHRVLNPEEEGDGGHHAGHASHASLSAPSAQRVAMAPTHAAASDASDGDVPAKAGSAAAAGGSLPTVDSLAARLAALRASRESE